jgi:hypothetical protein
MTPITRLLAATMLAVASISLGDAGPAYAQNAPKPKKQPKPDSLKKPVDSIKTPLLYTSEKLLPVTLTANFKALRGDKGETVPYRAATISWTGDDGKQLTVPLRAKTHGIWRLKHCDTPPLRLNFADKDTKGTIWHNVDKPKFVSVCKDRDSYEQYVLQEMQLYRIYQLLTPASHRVRAMRVTYVDSATGKVELTRYAFAFEDPDKLAARFGGKLIKTKGATADDLDPEASAITYLFEYMIGNTDFSFNGLHNGELLQKPNGTPLVPIAYDFDFSGAVNTQYATVDPKLSVRRVRDRLYRGYCDFNAEVLPATKLFIDKKAAIYGLYKDDLGKLMDPKIVDETLSWFDEFYESISTPRRLENDLLGACLGTRR